MDLVVCADFGSTFTKTLLVSLDDAAVVATAERRTTIDTDLLHGFTACRQQLARSEPAAADASVLACSSAGGGLRIAVVGNEELVTAEAGRRVALSSGGRVVHVGNGGLSEDGLATLHAADPDMLLLVGGTDGGNADVLMHAAEVLAERGWATPVVAAGNAEAAEAVTTVLGRAGVVHEMSPNVVPRIGVLAPEPARGAIRAVFLRHVIGGRHLSASAEFVQMLTGPTPDVVLTGTEVLAGLAGDVAVVDVGGATTDVHSVVEVDPEDAVLSRQVVAPTQLTRTVEGDLGMRWSAPSTVDAGIAFAVAHRSERTELTAAAQRRAADPGFVPAESTDLVQDLRLAAVACGAALRRHAGRQQVTLGASGRVLQQTGKDLREVELLVGSGGVFRHSSPGAVDDVLRGCTGVEVPGGWLLPRAPHLVVDRAYVLAAGGLLTSAHPRVASALLRRHLCPDG